MEGVGYLFVDLPFAKAFSFALFRMTRFQTPGVECVQFKRELMKLRGFSVIVAQFLRLLGVFQPNAQNVPFRLDVFHIVRFVSFLIPRAHAVGKHAE